MPGKALAPYLFRSERPASAGVSNIAGGAHSGYLGAALSTPGYWTKRFENLSEYTNVNLHKPIPPPTERVTDYDDEAYDSE